MTKHRGFSSKGMQSMNDYWNCPWCLWNRTSSSGSSDPQRTKWMTTWTTKADTKHVKTRFEQKEIVRSLNKLMDGDLSANRSFQDYCKKRESSEVSVTISEFHGMVIRYKGVKVCYISRLLLREQVSKRVGRALGRRCLKLLTKPIISQCWSTWICGRVRSKTIFVQIWPLQRFSRSVRVEIFWS